MAEVAVLASRPTLNDAAPAVQVRPCAAARVPVESPDRFRPACGAEQPVAAAAVEHRHFQCKNCGAEVAIEPSQRSYVCPFCDSAYVVEYTPEQAGRQPPEFVIGFAVKKKGDKREKRG